MTTNEQGLLQELDPSGSMPTVESQAGDILNDTGTATISTSNAEEDSNVLTVPPSPTAVERFAELKVAVHNMRTVMHRKQRDALCAAGYSYLADGSPDALLFAYWLSAPRTAEGTIPMSCKKYSRIIRRDPRIDRDRHDQVRKHIKALAVKSGIIVWLSRYDRNPDHPLATEITGLVLPEALHRIVYGRDPDLFKREGLIDVCTGRPLKYSQIKLRFYEALLAAGRVNELCAITEHREFLDYLNTTLNAANFRIGPTQINAALTYIDKLEREAADARERAEQMRTKGKISASDRWNAQAKRIKSNAEQTLQALYHVSYFPQPIYTIVERSPRFYASGVNMLTLPTDMRRAMLPHVIELDLVSAQAAIFAKIAGVFRLQQLLEAYQAGQGPSLWEYLFGVLHVIDLDEQTMLKPALKALLVYAVCFGMEEGRLLLPRRTRNGRNREKAEVQKALRAIGRDRKKRLLADPLIREWLDARANMLKQILTDGGLHDAEGRWISIGMADRKGDPFDEKSVLAWVAQSWEVKLLEPVRRMALAAAENTSHGWKIVFWQHDGFSITCRHTDARTICQQIGQAVAAQAAAFGMATGIECKYDGICNGELEHQVFSPQMVISEELDVSEDLVVEESQRKDLHELYDEDQDVYRYSRCPFLNSGMEISRHPSHHLERWNVCETASKAWHRVVKRKNHDRQSWLLGFHRKRNPSMARHTCSSAHEILSFSANNEHISSDKAGILKG